MGQETMTITSTQTTTVDNRDGSFTTTYASTSATFSTAQGQEGQFLGASTQTTTRIDSNRGTTVATAPSEKVSYAQAARTIGAHNLAKTVEATLPSYTGHLLHAIGSDMRAHPFYYVAVGLGGAALPVGGFSAVGGAVLGGGSIVSGTIDKTLY